MLKKLVEEQIRDTHWKWTKIVTEESRALVPLNVIGQRNPAVLEEGEAACQFTVVLKCPGCSTQFDLDVKPYGLIRSVTSEWDDLSNVTECQIRGYLFRED